MRPILVYPWVLTGFALAQMGCGSSAAVCDNDALASGCTAGKCRIQSAARPLPSNASVKVAEVPLPPDIGGDTLGTTVCQVTFPTGTNNRADVTLDIDNGGALPASAVLFMEKSPGVATHVPATIANAGVATGLIHTSGIYGLTQQPAPWSIDQVFGGDATQAVDEQSLLHNVASVAAGAATFDGQRLLVGNGNRVLVFNTLTPTPSTLPMLVVGQPDINTTLTQTSGTITPTQVQGIWTDGTRLAIAHGNRVLLWNTFPSAPLQPADLVLGQPDFATNTANTGGVSASTLFSACQVDSDGTRLVIADALNERVLVWNTFPSTSAVPADFVIGQPDFNSNAAFSGSTPLYLPYGATVTSAGIYVSSSGGPFSFVGPVAQSNPGSSIVFGWQPTANQPGTQVSRSAFAVAANGGLAERDSGLFRVNITHGPPTAAAIADIQLGQPDPTRAVGLVWADTGGIDSARVNASTFGSGVQLGSGPDALLVPDGHRLLVWEHFPRYHYEPATYVFGQPGFATNEVDDFRGVTASTLASPSDVATYGEVTAVADKGNNRVLLFKTSQLTTPNVAAYAALGQPDMSSFTANHDLRSPTYGTMSGPEGVCVDGNHLVVADTENHRVLIWNTIPTQSGAAADVILGQGSLNAIRPNGGRGDTSPVDGFSDAALDGFFYPTGVACDGSHLAVADKMNHRVLVWSAFPTLSSSLPDKLIGQASVSAVLANRGNGWATVVADGLDMPSGVALDGTSLWIADTENNRVVRWDNVFTTPQPAAFFGQPDGLTVSNPNYVMNDFTYTGNPAFSTPPTASGTINRPRSVLVSGGHVFVSELDSNRVHVLDKVSGASLAVIGQPNATTATPHTNGVTAATLADPSGLATDGASLFVLDTRAHRLLGFPVGALTTGVGATLVVGQPTMSSSGFNATTVAAKGAVSQPRGLASYGGKVYVADSGNSRVLAMDPSQFPWSTFAVYGQPDDKLALPNSGGVPSASTMNNPRGVYVDGTHMVVADTGNHRVLLYDMTSQLTSATVVLGQTSMSAVTANGSGATGGTLQAPGGVCSDGTKLAVADTSNHRVLIWNAMPTSNGQPADLVVGQATMNAIDANAGGSASASTFSFPSACLFEGGNLYVADTGNNRVLVFNAVPSSNNVAASAVIGQADFASRAPATTFNDLTRMAGPDALTTDGGLLYVVDRDLGRVLVYSRDNGTFAHTEIEMGGTTVSALHATGGVVASKTALFTSQLYISDSNASRVPRVVSVSRLLE